LEPTGPVRPTIDGEITSFFEWLGAGVYKADDRSGAMHSGRGVLREVHYGGDGESLFVRVDLQSGIELDGMEARITVDGTPPLQRSIRFNGDSVIGDAPLECAFRTVLEVRVPRAGASARFQLSFWRDGLPVDVAPASGWLEV
jgi:hypothetical protein